MIENAENAGAILLAACQHRFVEVWTLWVGTRRILVTDMVRYFNSLIISGWKFGPVPDDAGTMHLQRISATGIDHRYLNFRDLTVR